MAGDSPRTECEQGSRGAVWCRRMLYRPFEGARAGGATASTPASELSEGARSAPHQGPMEPDTRALPSSLKQPRAVARRTTLDETDVDLPQTTRMFEGARCAPTKPRHTAQPDVEPQCGEKRGEKNVVLVSV